MEEQRFDDLARLIAIKTSRRQVLKVLAGAAVGGFFGSRLSPVMAAGGGNSACAHFCNTTFGADTPAAAQCTSDAAHYQGLCYSPCGPGGSGETPCIGSDYSSTTCCGSGTTCVNGTCEAVCTTTTPTCTGDVCTCPTGTSPITTANNTTTCVKGCFSNLDCSGGVCSGNNSFTAFYCTNTGGPGVNCNSDVDCPSGTFCSGYGNNGGYLCAYSTC